jgi:hypothetical protein
MTQVTEHLEAHGVPFEPIAHQQTYTSIDEARVLGIDASEVLKTVAMRVVGGYALMTIPATCRFDMSGLPPKRSCCGTFQASSWAPCRRLARCWAHRSTSIRRCSSTKRWSLPQGARPNPFSSGRRIYSSMSR